MGGETPLDRAFEAALPDDEPVTDEEREALAEADEDERAGRLVSNDEIRELVQCSREPVNEQVRAKLAEYEEQYGMTTAEMKAAFKNGRLNDTPDIARWLVLSRLSGAPAL